MNWKSFVVKENEKFVRIQLYKTISIDELFDILNNKEFSLRFCVFVSLDCKYETRYNIPLFSNKPDFLKWISSNQLKLETQTSDSDAFSIVEASYIDLYFKYPNKY